MATSEADMPESTESLTNTLQSNWRMFLVAGVVIAAFGVFAMLSPLLTGISIALLVGLLLVGSAVLHFVGAFRGQGWRGFVWQVVLGVVTLIAGGAVLLNPAFGLATLTLLVIGYLLATGVVEVVMGLQLRGEKYWVWTVASGVVGIALAAMLWLGFPTTALWAVGVLFGANLLVTGTSMVALALGARSLTETTTEPAAGVGGV
ncbi:HdeD family acid-resistance protein [Halobium salinum]|uniref:HdeD family acid-resistance protein n=1 Tax=Halobium salinum TaxID=1364940 RepID=A0ABD5PHB3_9EURY|nr:HdeD family acid-resistance protein [Halobium salinum]